MSAAEQPGTRRTHLDHLPPAKVPGLVLNRTSCQARAEAIGPATAAVVHHLLDDPVIERLPTAGRLLRLCTRYSETRLEAACQRALHFDDPAYSTVKRILHRNLDAIPPGEETPEPKPSPRTFVRDAGELVGQLLGGLTWR